MEFLPQNLRLLIGFAAATFNGAPLRNTGLPRHMRILGILQAYIDSILSVILLDFAMLRLPLSLSLFSDPPSSVSVQPVKPHTDCSLILSQQQEEHSRVATMSVPESKYLSAIWRDNIFKDKVIFVTGGAGTICSMQTRAMVRLGANACILGRNASKTEAAAKDIATARPGAKVIGIGECDVRKIESLEAAAARCVKELGGIDYVIAGAAGNFVASIDKISSNAFKTVMDIDVIGTYNTIKATIPYLLQSSTPRIIAVSATFHYTGMPFQSHVSAAKAAVDSLIANVALEYGPRGVVANVIAPGPIADTEGMARLASSRPEEIAKFAKTIPSGRYGTVKDIADATVFLFSDASSYINGQIIPVDGASWRRQGAYTVGVDAGVEYPDFLKTEQISEGLKGGKKDKSKL
ncbi:hypothetical protein N5P37_001636 [Trichoderma harzianum]|nr:hypothetical protein N5P37_001636 [Trichoderma harzianum]